MQELYHAVLKGFVRDRYNLPHQRGNPLIRTRQFVPEIVAIPLRLMGIDLLIPGTRGHEFTITTRSASLSSITNHSPEPYNSEAMLEVAEHPSPSRLNAQKVDPRFDEIVNYSGVIAELSLEYALDGSFGLICCGCATSP